MNSIDEYYKSQAGNGIAGFSGVKYQKGFGFFGRLLSGAVLPFLRFIGKNALNAGANIAKDLVETDDFSLNNLKNSAKTRIKESAGNMIKRGADKILLGNGFRRIKKQKRMKRKLIVHKKKKKVIKVKKTNRKNIKKRTKVKKANCFLR